jgi:hypothetical protein
MEFTREMLKDQLRLCNIQKKTFERSFNISLVNSMCLRTFQVDDMIKNFVKNLWKKKPTQKSFKIKSFLVARAAQIGK